MTTGSTTRKRLTRAERREQLLDAAAELVVDGGLASVTMEGVAERAAVSKALPYAYFDNSSELLIALYERENAVLDAKVAERVTGATSFEEIVRGTLEAWLDVVDERGMLVGALLMEQVSGPLEVQRRQRLTTVQEFFARLVHAEFGLPLDVAGVAAGILLAGSLGVLDLWMHRTVDRDVLVDSFVRIATQTPLALRG